VRCALGQATAPAPHRAAEWPPDNIASNSVRIGTRNLLRRAHAGTEKPSIGKHESRKSIRHSSSPALWGRDGDGTHSCSWPVLSARFVVHQEPDKIESRRARINHSSRNCKKLASAAADFAMTTTSQPGSSNARCRRQISRKRRRKRLRVTALPTLREVTNPNRVALCAGFGATLRRNNRPCAERPSERTNANSRLSRMRVARGNRSLSGLGVPGVGNLDTFGQQPFATALAAAAEGRASALRLHPSAKTELPLACALAWLIGAFHRFGKNGARKDTPFRLRVNPRNSVATVSLRST
jgi:hypothetical protein